ncbi:MAG: LysR family transcriptional regulator [Succinivibrio sp.]|nr:LysR family transcriptional regulator [Succinivibrio sp.]
MLYFKAVVDKMNFYEAAEICNVSQSAVSQQIKSLEEELGVLLLKRHNRSFSLTEAGKIFYRRATVILSDIEIMKNEVIKTQRHNRTNLRIGYLMNYEGYELQNAVASFMHRNPNSEIDLIPGTHESLYELLRTERIDIAFNDQRRAFSDDYKNIELAELYYSVEISKFHPYANLSEIEVADLKNFSCIVVATPEQELSEFKYYHEILGFNGDFLFARNIGDARFMVSSGKGVFPIIESKKTSSVPESIVRLPLVKEENPIKCRICLFTKKAYTSAETDEIISEFKRFF